MAETHFQLLGFCSAPFASFLLAAFTPLYGFYGARTSQGLACIRGKQSGPDISDGGGTASCGAAPVLPSGTLTFAEAVFASASASAPAQNQGDDPRHFPRQRHRRCSRPAKLAWAAARRQRGPANMKLIAKLINWGTRALRWRFGRLNEL
jgi:hypothetical protein